MKRKLALVLAGVMVMTALTGCAEQTEEVTAKSLLKNAFDTEYLAYQVEANVKLCMEDYDDGTNVVIKMDTSNECSPETSHMEGEVSIKMKSDGYSETVNDEADIYSVLDDDQVIDYSYDFDNDFWLIEEEDADVESFIPELTSKMFDDLEVEETNKGFEVTGVVKDIDAIFGANSGTMRELLDAVEDCDMETTLVFDEDKVLETYSIVVETDEDESYDVDGMGEVTFSEFEIVITIESYEGKEVKIPSSVKKNAMTEDEWYSEVEDEEEKTESVCLGTITDTTYTNSFFNIGWKVPSNQWKILSREETDELYNYTISNMEIDSEVLENAQMFFDMCAINTSTYDNVNLAAENLGSYASYYDEETYMELTVESIKEEYESAGYTDVSFTISTVEIFGQEHVCVLIEYTDGDTTGYQIQVEVKSGQYMLAITATSGSGHDACYEMLSYFYTLAI